MRPISSVRTASVRLSVPTDKSLLTVLPEAYTRHRDPLHNPLQLHPGVNPRLIALVGSRHIDEDTEHPAFPAGQTGQAA